MIGRSASSSLVLRLSVERSVQAAQGTPSSCELLSNEMPCVHGRAGQAHGAAGARFVEVIAEKGMSWIA
jgi:hypothetical protein